MCDNAPGFESSITFRYGRICLTAIWRFNHIHGIDSIFLLVYS